MGKEEVVEGLYYWAGHKGSGASGSATYLCVVINWWYGIVPRGSLIQASWLDPCAGNGLRVLPSRMAKQKIDQRCRRIWYCRQRRWTLEGFSWSRFISYTWWVLIACELDSATCTGPDDTSPISFCHFLPWSVLVGKMWERMKRSVTGCLLENSPFL